MQILDVKPNTSEWLKAREERFCASEAPAMMGCSPYKTRTQLLDEKKGWKAEEEISAFKQNLFQKGHEFEEKQRTFIELDMMLDIPPVVGIRKFRGIKTELLASLDGYNEPSKVIWEHKSWNEKLVANVSNGILEPFYYWQLEHQCLVADLKEVMFTVSNGTYDQRITMTYKSVPERRKELVAGWKQFEKDLETHELQAKKTVTVEAPTVNLPAIVADVSNGVITTNVQEVLNTIKTLAEDEMSRELVSDFDFSAKENLTKAVKKARESLKAKVAAVEAGFTEFADFRSVAAELDSILQKMQSDGEKKVKTEKEKRIQAIIDEHRQSVIDYLRAVSEPFEGLEDSIIFNAADYTPDFKAAVKGKRTLESMDSACRDLAAQAKISISETAELASENLGWIKDGGLLSDYGFLFRDLESILTQQQQAFQAICKQRISDYGLEQKEKEEAKKAEEARLAAQTPEPEQTQAEPEFTGADMAEGPGETVTATATNTGPRNTSKPHITVDEVIVIQDDDFSPAKLLIRFGDSEFSTVINMKDGPVTVVSKLYSLANEITAKLK